MVWTSLSCLLSVSLTMELFSINIERVFIRRLYANEYYVWLTKNTDFSNILFHYDLWKPYHFCIIYQRLDNRSRIVISLSSDCLLPYIYVCRSQAWKASHTFYLDLQIAVLMFDIWLIVFPISYFRYWSHC